MNASLDSPAEALALLAIQLLERAEALGASRGALLGEAGLTETDLREPDASIPMESLYRLWETCMRVTRSPGLPLAVGEATELSDLRLYGFLIMTSEDVRQAIGRAIRFSRLLTTCGRWDLLTSGEEARVVWEREGGGRLGVRVANESALATFLHTFRDATSSQVPITEVSFRHRAPLRVDAHEAFFDCPVRWTARTDSFAFPVAALDVVPKDANPALASFLSERAEARLLELPDAPVSMLDRVRSRVATTLADGPLQLEDCARGLGMSPRTLNRRLRELGTTYSKLLEEVRRERSERALRTRVSITEIAFVLGYSDASAFSRAFRRWNGVSPAAFRRRESS